MRLPLPTTLIQGPERRAFVRALALSALISLGACGDAPASTDPTQPDIRSLAAGLQDPKPAARVDAARALATRGSAVSEVAEEILSALRDPSDEVRYLLVVALRESGVSRADVIRALMALQSDTTERVSEAAAYAITRLRPPESLAIRRWLPPTYEFEEERVLVTPERFVAVEIPAVYRRLDDGAQVQVAPSRTEWRKTPAEYRTVVRRRVLEPGGWRWIEARRD